MGREGRRHQRARCPHPPERTGKTTEPIHELELELKDGDREALYRLAAALQADVLMIIGAESTAARGGGAQAA